MFDTPILYLIFNRPDLTEITFPSICNVKPKKLFIAADGPRTGNPDDELNCKIARQYVLSKIDWDCEVQTLFRDENLGCGKAVSSAISWFFSNVDEGIILEDDCLPDESFFKFCSILLDRYKNDEQIMHIGGNNFQFGIKRGDGDYYYSILGHIWGWATWRRAWKHYEFNLVSANPISEESFYRAFNQNDLFINYYKGLFKDVANNKIDTWDYQWFYTILRIQGFAICPNINLVENIGFDKNATHTKKPFNWNLLNHSKSIKSFLKPATMALNYDADSYLLSKVVGINRLNAEKKLKLLYRLRSKIFKFLRNSRNLKFKKKVTWKNLEYFDESWKVRIKIMAKYIIPGCSVMDLGCGEMWLKDYISNESKYFGVDYKRRVGGNLVCDFNKYEFPDFTTDYIFISGCLEYIEDVDWFIHKISKRSSYVILSYCTLEYFNDLKLRKSHAWVNHFSRDQLMSKFQNVGFKIENESITESKNSIFYFSLTKFNIN